MDFGELHRFRIVEAPGEIFEPLFLGGKVLGMHEGHVEPAARNLRQGRVEAARNRLARNAERLGIGRPGPVIVAIDVARELVEQDDEGERAFRLAHPIVVIALRRRLHRIAELAADFRVEGVAFREPLLRPGIEPEIEHVAGADEGHRAAPKKMSEPQANQSCRPGESRDGTDFTAPPRSHRRQGPPRRASPPDAHGGTLWRTGSHSPCR